MFKKLDVRCPEQHFVKKILPGYRAYESHDVDAGDDDDDVNYDVYHANRMSAAWCTKRWQGGRIHEGAHLRSAGKPDIAHVD